jgi:hypothetical protein
MVVCTFVPWLQDNVFYTANPGGLQAGVPHFFFLVFIMAYTEASKTYARRHPSSQFVKWFIW